MNRGSLPGLAAVVLLVLGFAGLYAFIHCDDALNTWRDPPVYPGAYDVVVQDYGPSGIPQDDPHLLYIRTMKKVSFSVDGGPDPIRYWYFDKLRGQGWMDSPTKGSSGETEFVYFGGEAEGLMFYIYFSEVPATKLATRVHITTKMYSPR